MRADRDRRDHDRLAAISASRTESCDSAPVAACAGAGIGLALVSDMHQQTTTLRKPRRPRFIALLAVLAGLHAAGCSSPPPPPPPPDPSVTGRSGVTHNAITMNALTTNALTTNAANLQALIAGKLADASFETGSLSEAMWDPSAQQVMAYLASCALAPDQSVTWRPAWSVGPAPPAITWTGALALCPQWHDDGIASDSDCQELVSACLLARNNAAGVEVAISLRGRDVGESYFGSGEVLIGDVIHPEHELYRWREGAFYGNILDPSGVDLDLEVRVDHDPGAGQIEVSYWRVADGTRLAPVFQMSAATYTASSAGERIVTRAQGHDDFIKDWQGGTTRAYRNAFACWSPEWSEAAAYFRERTCAGPSDKERCLAEAVGACETSTVIPGAPQLQCNHMRTPPDGHGDFDDCNGADQLWRFPITVFLQDSCALVSGSCDRIDQTATQTQVAARTRKVKQP